VRFQFERKAAVPMPEPGKGGTTRRKWQVWADRKARAVAGIVVMAGAVVTAAGDIGRVIEVIIRHL
jgi:hypothetical protein